jgi:hydrogenase maturation protease
MSRPRVLVAGVGNIFLGDDAFGVEVAQRLLRRSLPDDVKVVDFGIRGIDLVYAILEDYDAVVLVDATPRGGQPGSLYVLQPELDRDLNPDSPETLMSPHNLDPANVLRLAAAMGGRLSRLIVVGCEPTPLNADQDMAMGLSEPVQAAIAEAVELVLTVVDRIVCGEQMAIAV